MIKFHDIYYYPYLGSKTDTFAKLGHIERSINFDRNIKYIEEFLLNCEKNNTGLKSYIDSPYPVQDKFVVNIAFILNGLAVKNSFSYWELDKISLDIVLFKIDSMLNLLLEKCEYERYMWT